MTIRNVTQTVCSTFRIRDISWAYNNVKDISLCINRTMSFSAFHVLSAIIAALSYSCGCFDGLTIDNTRGWFDIAFLRLSRFCQDIRMDHDNCAIFRPFIDIIANNTIFWEIMGQIAPLATGTWDIEAV